MDDTPVPDADEVSTTIGRAGVILAVAGALFGLGLFAFDVDEVDRFLRAATVGGPLLVAGAVLIGAGAIVDAIKKR